jgi:hypothetical protein
LGPDALQCLLRIESIPLHEPSQLHFLGHGHDQNLVNPFLRAGFEQQRRFVYDQPMTLRA